MRGTGDASPAPMRILAIALALALAGCDAYVEPRPTYVTAGEVDGYVPAYYDGYVVYYDDVGRPYYYGPNGVAIWVEPGSPHYWGLVQHWRVYGRAYPRWVSHDGYRYRSYRATPGYHAYGTYRGHYRATPHVATPAHRR